MSGVFFPHFYSILNRKQRHLGVIWPPTKSFFFFLQLNSLTGVLYHDHHMSPVKRICVFEHSILTNFNCACPAIQRGQGPGFLSEGSSWLTAYMSEQWRFWLAWTFAARIGYKYQIRLTRSIYSFSCTLFLRQFHLNFFMHYFIIIMLKYLHCSEEMFCSAPMYDIDVKTFGEKWCQNWYNNVKKTPWHHACVVSSYTPRCKTTFPCTGQSCRNSSRVYKRIYRYFHITN